MNKLYYIFLLNVAALGAIIFYLFVHLYFKFEQNKSTTDFAGKTVEEVQQSKVVLEQTLIRKDTDIQTKDKTLDQEKEKSIELSRKLSDKINEALILKDKVTRKEAQIQTLEESVKKEKEAQAPLVEELEKLKKENEDLKQRLEQMKKVPQMVGNAEFWVGDREQVEEKPAPVKVRREEGLVLTVNKEFNFVVVALGEDDGIEQGQVLTVFRDNMPLGRVRVEKVYEKMCQAVMLQETLKDKVLVQGDVIKIL